MDSNAETKKNQGNEEFKKGNFQAAILFFSEAIELDPTEAYYTNRALALMAVNK
jgi:Flp pilus assembly protein TadD